MIEMHTHAFTMRTGVRGNWDARILREVPLHYDIPAARIREARTVIDVGAHIGGFSAWVKLINPTAQVIAVELDGENAELARLNMRRWPDVVVYHAQCAYAAPRTMVLRDPENTGNVSVRGIGDPRVEAWEPAGPPPEAVTVELLMQRHSMHTLDVLKLDCEGAEYDILAHIRADTLQTVRAIIGEYHRGIDTFRARLLPRLSLWFDVAHLLDAPDWGTFCLVRRV